MSEWTKSTSPEFYRGHAYIHWTLNIENRETGWLTPEFHQKWKLTFLHTCARYRIASPTYVLMPDHLHFLGLGLHIETDQRVAGEFLRKHLRPAMGKAEWQRQPHDQVLREYQRERGAFQAAANYILENPIRAKLVKRVAD